MDRHSAFPAAQMHVWIGRWSVVLAFVLLGLGLNYSAVSAQDPNPPIAQPNPNAGTDPIGKPTAYSIFRDDEIYIPGIGGQDGNLNAVTYSPDANLALLDPQTVGGPIPDYQYDPQIAADRGRVTTQAYDQVVMARRFGILLAIDMYDQSMGSATQSTILPGEIIPRWTDFSEFVSVRVGDLDKYTDVDGNNHDEVVVVYAGPGNNGQTTVNVQVLDYTDPSTATSFQPIGGISATASTPIDANPQIFASDNILDVAIGDFDGNGLNEIAVVYLQNQTTLWVTTFRYTNAGGGNRTLAQIGAVSEPAAFAEFLGTVSAAAGDFNGDSVDELAIATIQSDTPYYTDYANIYIFRTDTGLNPIKATFFSTGSYNPGQNTAFFTPRVQVVSGLFAFNPNEGLSFSRRQIAVAFNDSFSNFVIQPYLIGANLTSYSALNGVELEGILFSTEERWSLAAGAYRGNADIQNPVWDLIYSITNCFENCSGVTVSSYDVTEDDIEDTQEISGFYVYPQMRMPLVAFDLDGDSVFLGAPIHLQTGQVVRTDFILQEPPKHTYYDSVPNPTNNFKPSYQIVNISRYDNFDVSLQDSNGTSFSTTHADTSNWSIGGSATASASDSITLGENVGIYKVESTVSTSFSATVGYNYNENQSSYNSGLNSQSLSVQGNTDHDDLVIGRTQIFDIWRYRVYGPNVKDILGNDTNGFYDIIFPGVGVSFQSPGLALDGYEPVYENGNILSYPSALGSQPSDPLTPDDLGPFTLPNGTTVLEPMVPASEFTFGGTSGNQNLQYSQSSGGGSSRTYQHTLSESADLAVSVEAKEDVLFGSDGGESKFGFEAQFSNSNSWGGTSTSSDTTNETTGITMNMISGPGTQGYEFFPVFYMTQDGTVKVAHAVDVLGSAQGRSFWTDYYGSKPDAALNLPNRFQPVYSVENTLNGWKPVTDDTRKEMRGFSLTDPVQDPTSGEYNYLIYPPTDGDMVRVEAAIYNYSTGKTLSNLEVLFELVPYNSAGIPIPATSCPPGSQLKGWACVLGTTTLDPMDPLERDVAVFQWNTSGFAPQAPCATAAYRMNVVLDPNNQIAELYETEVATTQYPYNDSNGDPQTLPKGIDPGQNNMGWSDVNVIQKSKSGGTCSDGSNADMSLKGQSLAVMNTRTQTLVDDKARVSQFESTPIRVTAFSSKKHRGTGYVLIYDGDPDKNGELLAIKRVHTGNPKGAHVWFNWVPRTVGTHTLYARLLSDATDRKPGNGEDIIKVNVVAPRPRPTRPR